MYNSDMPTRAELPSSRQLLRSTAIAAAAAAALLVTVVLPAEYAIDPTGVGSLLGLTTMGEVKGQLAREAEVDRHRDATQVPGRGSSVLPGLLKGLLIGEARAEPAAVTQEASVTLAPGEGGEIKMAMKASAKADYRWTASGGVNYDMHGTAPGGKESSYKRGRGTTNDSGILTAGYDGHHGWFWRNRGQEPVTVTVKVSGDFTDLKRMK